MALRNSNYINVRIKDRSMFGDGNEGLEEFYKYIKDIVKDIAPRGYRVLNYEIIQTNEIVDGGAKLAKLSIEIKRG